MRGEIDLDEEKPIEYIAEDGTVLTDEVLDAMAKRYESGDWGEMKIDREVVSRSSRNPVLSSNSILLVEDDASIAQPLCELLRSEGYQVTVAGGQQAAYAAISSQRFDLLLIDISLPDGSGYAVCTAARNSYPTAVIFFTASDDEASVVTGLDLGADDYITKPFRAKELLSRVKSVLRRSGKSQAVFEVGDLVVDTVRGTVKKA